MRGFINKVTQQFHPFPFNRQIQLPFLQLLSFGNILADASNAIHLARFIADRKRPIPHPADGSIRPDQPVFCIIMILTLPGEIGQHPLLVFRVNGFSERQCIGIQTGGRATPNLLVGGIDVKGMVLFWFSQPERFRNVVGYLVEIDGFLLSLLF